MDKTFITPVFRKPFEKDGKYHCKMCDQYTSDFSPKKIEDGIRKCKACLKKAYNKRKLDRDDVDRLRVKVYNNLRSKNHGHVAKCIDRDFIIKNLNKCGIAKENYHTVKTFKSLVIPEPKSPNSLKQKYRVVLEPVFEPKQAVTEQPPRNREIYNKEQEQEQTKTKTQTTMSTESSSSSSSAPVPPKKGSQVNQLVNKVVNEVIETPIAVLKERVKTTPREQVIEKIQAVTAELIKLQYTLREYSMVEWYDKELDDRRKHLHDVYERNREFFKAGANGDNWLAICNPSKSPANVNCFEEFLGGESDDQGPYYFAFFKDAESLNKVIDDMRRRDTNKLLCVPIFKAV